MPRLGGVGGVIRAGGLVTGRYSANIGVVDEKRPSS